MLSPRSTRPLCECCRDLTDIRRAGERLLQQVSRCTGGDRGWPVVDAMNLDGGGSTTLVPQGIRRTGPTDTIESDGKLNWSERKLGDSIYVGKGGTPLP